MLARTFALGPASAATLLLAMSVALPQGVEAVPQNPQQTTAQSTAQSTPSSDKTTSATATTPDANAADQSAAEMTTKDETPTLRVRSNLVLARVIVRDAHGKAISGLTKDDFRLFDGKKEQFITQFTVTTGPPAPGEQTITAKFPEGETPPAAPADFPQRYVGLYFDDVHVSLQDLQPLRLAALRYVEKELQPGERAGIFTSSGQDQVDFTADKEKLAEKIRELMPHSLYTQSSFICPDIEPYQAWLIVDMNDPTATEAAAYEVLHCKYNDNKSYQSAALSEASADAVDELSHSSNESMYTMRGLDGLVKRMGTLPGTRMIVLASPGFLDRDDPAETGDLVDKALRAEVVISSLDARGLYTPPSMGDVSQDTVVTGISEGPKAQIENMGAMAYSEPLALIAHGTGGTFFQNSNDLDEGFRLTGGMPETAYILGFVPVDEKIDGSFHQLSVKLTNGAMKGYSVQARPGYYAPKKAANPAEQADEEISDAVFSQQPLSELPLDIHTSFYGGNGQAMVMTVVAHVDVRSLKFTKADGRNTDQMTLTTALFDSNGNFVSGQQKKIEFKLRDTSKARLEKSGMTLRTSFDVNSGKYMVRSVVRDEGGPSMAAANQTVEIP